MTLEWESFYLSLPSEVLKLVKQRAEELGWTDQAVICDVVEKHFNWKEVKEDMVSIEIPKSLYDQIEKFTSVEYIVVEEMSLWIQNVEEEEKIAQYEQSLSWLD